MEHYAIYAGRFQGICRVYDEDAVSKNEVHILGFACDGRKVQLPTYFRQPSKGHGNSVCHAQFLDNVIMQPLNNLRDTDGKRIILGGRCPTEISIVRGPRGDSASARKWIQVSDARVVEYYCSVYCGPATGTYNVEHHDNFYWVDEELGCPRWGFTEYTLGAVSTVDEFVNKVEGLLGVSSGPDVSYDMGWSRWWYENLEYPEFDSVPANYFKLSEPDWFWKGWTANTSSATMAGLMDRCFYTACESIPRAGENNIANIVEVCGIILSLINGDAALKALDVYDWHLLSDAPNYRKFLWDTRNTTALNVASDAWLGYRYCYSTTRSDVDQALRYCGQRLSAYGSHRRKVGGVSYDTINGTKIQCRVTGTVYQPLLDAIAGAGKRLWQQGLEFNFAVLWDLIPLSFIVDWFLPVGTLYQVRANREHYLNSTEFVWEDLWYSLSYVVDNEDMGRVKCYTRFRGGVPPLYEESFLVTEASVSTVAKRTLDGASLSYNLLRVFG